MKSLSPMMEHMGQEGIRICHNLVKYSKKWKQLINVQKTVGQLFSTQIELYMAEQCRKLVNKFKYLSVTRTSNLSLKPTIDQGLEKVKNGNSKTKIE